VSIEPRGAQHVLHDLGSTNGTLVNGARLSGDRELREGDQICIGQTIIKFTLVDETEAAYLRKMERLAGTDELSGLLAKHRFDSLLAEAARSATATGSPLSLLMLDMDGLRSINDRHGHPMGAHTIGSVGRIIGRVVSGHGEACRFGGDEYCVMLVGSDLAAAMKIGEQIREAVAATPYELGGATVRATISIGAAQLSDAAGTPETLLAAADQALYRAKGKGRNAVSD
jgi:diguanylate cyclase (GGDEF)-like protein